MAADSRNNADFSAASAALGYLYQIRLALLSSLRRISRDEVFAAYLETLDDVVFETDGSPTELLQLKHRCERAADLSDASPDLWKSFRVWMEGRGAGRIPDDARLYLVTTSSISQGSAASYLITTSDRDEDEALKRLEATATTSSNAANEPAYAVFRGLSPEAKSSLISSIVVLPNAPNIEEVAEELRTEARLAVRREHLQSFLTRLEGWWFGRVVQQLTDPDSAPIHSTDLESEFDDLREQFKRDALPVDEDILEAEVDAAAYEDAVFVHQVKLVDIGNPRVLAAIRDYYRAFEQRSRWTREELLLVGELSRYEQLLVEEWELQFNRIADEIGEAAAEDAKRQAAKRIYAWVEESCFPIRPQVPHPSMSRGSFHILSDKMRVGWHPEFRERLKHLLEPRRAT